MEQCSVVYTVTNPTLQFMAESSEAQREKAVAKLILVRAA